jgi:hypothetical protein
MAPFGATLLGTFDDSIAKFVAFDERVRCIRRATRSRIMFLYQEHYEIPSFRSGGLAATQNHNSSSDLRRERAVVIDASMYDIDVSAKRNQERDDERGEAAKQNGH